uniref:Importin N-terminal domain-containing protein n=1 Tax=Steinernema glaseri TaxID=37863 RepID=A0A1I7Y5P7_9BILA
MFQNYLSTREVQLQQRTAIELLLQPFNYLSTCEDQPHQRTAIELLLQPLHYLSTCEVQPHQRTAIELLLQSFQQMDNRIALEALKALITNEEKSFYRGSMCKRYV